MAETQTNKHPLFDIRFHLSLQLILDPVGWQFYLTVSNATSLKVIVSNWVSVCVRVWRTHPVVMYVYCIKTNIWCNWVLMGGWVENCKAIVGKLSLVNVLNFICLSLSSILSLSLPAFFSPFPFSLSPPSFLSLSLSLSFSFFTVFSITTLLHMHS